MKKLFCQSMISLLSATLLATGAQAQKVYEVVPNGTGLQSLQGVQEEIRKTTVNMTQDIVVLLNDGVYELEEPLRFDTEDGGKGSFTITYKAKDGAHPVVSGGYRVSNWTVCPDNSNLLQANIENLPHLRNLYVNGRRAKRASGDARKATALYQANGETKGLLFPKTEIPEFHHPSAIEINYLQNWRNYYFHVDSIVDGKNLPDVADDHYLVMIRNFNWSYTMPYRALSPGAGEGAMNQFYFENAEELLDEPGEWCFVPSTHTLYYYAQPGETPETLEAYVPRLEQLVEIKSSQENQNVRNLIFEGIEFSHNAWNWPSENGFTPIQSSAIVCDNNAPAGDAEDNDQRKIKIPGAISIEDARNIRFRSNKFTHLGSNGIDLKNNTDSVAVESNAFYDISGCAISMASWAHRTYNFPGEKPVNHTLISNNYIEKIAAEYASCVAIEAFYAENLKIEHNELFDLPYSGISVGWGWHISPSSQRNVEILNNSIVGVIQQCYDGGAIYSLSHFSDKGLRIEGNYIDEITLKPRSNREGAIYTDEQSSNVYLNNNVIKSNRKWYYFNMAGTVSVDTTYVPVGMRDNRGGNQSTNTHISYVNGGSHIFVLPNRKADQLIEQAGMMKGQEAPDLCTKNIALNCPVTATSSFPGYSPLGLVDGNTDVMWHSGEKNCPNIYIDLKSAYQLTEIELVMQQKGESYEETRRNFVIELSNDPSFPEEATTVVYELQSDPIPARSTIRIHIDSDKSYRYIRARKTLSGEHLAFAEIRAYGQPAVASGTNNPTVETMTDFDIHQNGNQLHVQLANGTAPELWHVRILDLQGRCISAGTARHTSHLTLPVGSMGKGIYLIDVQAGASRRTIRQIID